MWEQPRRLSRQAKRRGFFPEAPSFDLTFESRNSNYAIRDCRAAWSGLPLFARLGGLSPGVRGAVRKPPLTFP